jgi:hypothetical protein
MADGSAPSEARVVALEVPANACGASRPFPRWCTASCAPARARLVGGPRELDEGPDLALSIGQIGEGAHPRILTVEGHNT